MRIFLGMHILLAPSDWCNINAGTDAMSDGIGDHSISLALCLCMHIGDTRFILVVPISCMMSAFITT